MEFLKQGMRHRLATMLASIYQAGLKPPKVQPLQCVHGWRNFHNVRTCTSNEYELCTGWKIITWDVTARIGGSRHFQHSHCTFRVLTQCGSQRLPVQLSAMCAIFQSNIIVSHECQARCWYGSHCCIWHNNTAVVKLRNFLEGVVLKKHLYSTRVWLRDRVRSIHPHCRAMG
jgi:hypothetical protein